jgi:hypothetical protein
VELIRTTECDGKPAVVVRLFGRGDHEFVIDAEAWDRHRADRLVRGAEKLKASIDRRQQRRREY